MSRRARIGGPLWAVQPLPVVAELSTVSGVRAPHRLRGNTTSDAAAVRRTTITCPFGQVPVRVRHVRGC